MPGGVNSPVRSFAAVEEEPLFIDSGKGAVLVDVQGRRYTDFVLGYGPHILGHAPQAVVSAIRRQLAAGISYGSNTEAELLLAEKIVQMVPSIEMVRLVNSGTEATMSALRLARASTGRDLVVKFEGGYHGHSDSLLVAAGSGAATHGVPSSPGVPAATAADTVVLPYNGIAEVADLFMRLGDRIAAVIVEPVAGNMGVVAPDPEFLPQLRRLTSLHGSVLIFDEVMTGFRLAQGGAQELYGCRPDLTCLGKVIGGGLPVGAYGGRKELMSLMSPSGPVYQAGTMSGNPLVMAAGLATLEQLSSQPPYDYLEKTGSAMEDGARAVLRQRGIGSAVNRVGSMISLFFGVDSVRNYSEAAMASRSMFARFHQQLRQLGVLWPPSQMESAFLCVAHGAGEVDQVLSALASYEPAV